MFEDKCSTFIPNKKHFKIKNMLKVQIFFGL